LIGPESEEPGANEKVTEAAKKIGKRMFGEREDIEDRPIEYKITPEALRLRLDIRSSMDKEESLRLLRDKRKDLAELHQKITDRKKQDRILEALNAIGKLIEEERQRSSSPKKKYIPNMYPLVPYVDNNLSHLKRNHMMLQNNI